MIKKVISAVLIVLMIVLVPISVLASTSTWPTFGKNQQRVREAVAQHTQPPLFLKWQAKNIGWSISQPIVAGNFIFHQAGGYLYKIPLNTPFTGKKLSVNSLLKQGTTRKKISNKYHAASHPVYDAKTNRIYVGTGDNKIRKVNPNSLVINQTINAYGRLVDAPTILGKDLIAYGTGKAQLYVNKLTQTRRITLGSSPMEITGTFAVKKGKNPIIFVPINYKGLNHTGFVDAYKIIDRGKGKAPTYKFVWKKPFKTKNGVSASVVYDKERDRIYFADKSGTVYAVNAKNGKKVWQNSRFHSASVTTTLVNNSPAFSGNTLVIPYRYQGGRNRGMIAAFNVNNGHVKWTRTSAGKPRSSGTYNGEIAEAPAINTDGDGNSLVMVGTTKGDMRAFNLNNGKPHFITEKNGKKKNVLHALGGKSSSYYQGQGIATEILIADGHLIFGANTSASPNSHGTNGTLYAYSTPWAQHHPGNGSSLVDLSGWINAGKTHYKGLPLYINFAPTNVGTTNVKKKFATKLYINGINVDISEYNGLKVDEKVGKMIKVPSRWSTAKKGKHHVKLVVDAYNDVDEAIEDNNIIEGSYTVVDPPPFKCEEGWKKNEDGSGCVKTWTKVETKKNYVRPVLVR